MIKVRKPFDFDLEDNKKDEEKEIHLEYEEKPIIKNSEKTENSHGGNEVTYSLNSENESSEETEDNKNTESSESKEANSENSESVDETSENSDETENSGSNKVSEEMNNESSEESSECSDSVEDIEDETESDSSDYNESKESENSESDSSEEAENAEDSNKAESVVDGEENSDETENSDEDSESEETDSNEQFNNYNYNTQEVVDLLKAESNVRFYQTEFYRFIELIADEKTKIFDNRSAEEFNVKKLLFRAFERKSLNHYRMQRIKESVVLILDNSGSMDWWAQNLQQLAEIARKRDDVEIFIAPNGWFERKIAKTKISDIDHETTIKELCGRKVIYVGDFDGANTAIQLSWCNSVVWVCPESRYRRFKSHDWVHYDESSFRGAFLRVYSLEEMFSAFRRLLAHQYFNNIWIDLHSNEKFEDD